MMSRLALLALVLWAPSVRAATFTFTDSSSFLGALPGPATTLDFESTPAGTVIPSGGSLGGITFSYSLAPAMLKVSNAFDTTSGSNFLGLTGGDEALLDGDVISLGAASPVRAFGLFVITSDPALPGEIQLVTSVGTAFNSATRQATLGDGGLVYFLGLSSTTPFSAATLEFANDGQTNFLYNVDDITTAVPEPETFVLAALLLVLGARRKPIGPRLRSPDSWTAKPNERERLEFYGRLWRSVEGRLRLAARLATPCADRSRLRRNAPRRLDSVVRFGG